MRKPPKKFSLEPNCLYEVIPNHLRTHFSMWRSPDPATDLYAFKDLRVGLVTDPSGSMPAFTVFVIKLPLNGMVFACLEADDLDGLWYVKAISPEHGVFFAALPFDPYPYRINKIGEPDERQRSTSAEVV